MKLYQRLLCSLAAAVSCGGYWSSAAAHEPRLGPTPVEPPAAIESRALPPTAPAAPSAGAVAPVLDPFMQDLLVALVAAMLREAAMSPDPMTTFGESLERKLSLVLSSPEAVRALETALARGLQDVPQDLREPLALFAGSLLRSAQRDFGNTRSRPRY